MFYRSLVLEYTVTSIFAFQISLIVLACFCKEACAPLPVYTPAALPYGQFVARDELVASYFRQQYKNKEILMALASVHGIIISLATVERILKRLGLKRKVPITDELLNAAVLQIEAEISESGCNIGYRNMWKRLRRKGIFIPMNTVRKAMKELDPEGVQRRRMKRLRRRSYVNPGPNFVWHIDGYDKLKPYGFAIHGAIDGFSRRILWIEVGVTNNNPKVIAKYFLLTALQHHCIPAIVRADRGTENVNVRDIQRYLRRDGDDEFAGEESYMEGRSTANQRIEAWWAILRKQCVNFWMNLFKDMMFNGLLNTADNIHVHALRFCFMRLIAKDIERVAIEWNQHNIQHKRGAEGPYGKPDLLYYAPGNYHGEQKGIQFNEDEAEVMLDEIENGDSIPDNCDPLFLGLINDILPDWEPPTNVDSALDLYVDILDSISELQ